MGKIPVLEVYTHPTIQGEGPLIGKKVLFVRTAGCDYRCSWCVVEGSQVMLSDGSLKAIEDVAVLDEVVGFDDHQWLVRTTQVDNVLIREHPECYEIVTGERTVVATGDHRWWTLSGWKSTRDLDEHEEIAVVVSPEDAVCSWETLQSVPKFVGSRVVYDLTCSPYASFVANGFVGHNCDSSFTWDGSEKGNTRLMSADELWEECAKVVDSQGRLNYNMITISGGNPALVGGEMWEFLRICRLAAIATSLETQGSKIQSWFNWIDYLVVSPKPPSSLQKTNYGVLDRLVGMYGDKVYLKVVVFDDRDFDYARDLHKRYSDLPMYLQVGNEHVGSGEDFRLALLDKLSWLSGRVLEDADLNDVTTLPQLHTLMWGNNRGV